MTEVWKQGITQRGVAQNSRSVNISIADLAKKNQHFRRKKSLAQEKKGGNGQMLNIEANASPQLTSKTPYDYPATTNIIPENSEKVNTLDKKIQNTRQIEHILKDHGENGKSDRSMADASDIARLEFTLVNYDDLRLAGKSHAYKNVINGTTQASLTVLYEKDLGEKSYYAIQAVPDTKAKTLFVVTSYIGKQGYKKEVSQFINAKNLDVTSEIEIATPSISIIPPTDEKINTFDEKNR